MPDCMTFEELKTELSARLVNASRTEIESLASLFVDIAGGKYVGGRGTLKRIRNLKIREFFDGTNLETVAARFGLSKRQIRRLLSSK